MMTPKMIRRLGMMTLLVVAARGHAVGLDEMKPQAAPPEAATPADSTKAAEGAAGEAPAEGAAKAGETTETPAAAEEKKPIEPSETSKKLADKLSVGTSFGWTTVSSAKGDWHGGGASDIAVGYRLPWKFAKDSIKTNASFRYAPMDVTVQEGVGSYRGTVEGWNLGIGAEMNVSARWTALASLETGLLIVHLNKLDDFAIDSDLESGGIHTVLGLGANWQVSPKWYVGPKVFFGAGRITTSQACARLTFVF